MALSFKDQTLAPDVFFIASTSKVTPERVAHIYQEHVIEAALDYDSLVELIKETLEQGQAPCDLKGRFEAIVESALERVTESLNEGDPNE